MKLEKAPQETYADIGGLDAQIQEMKVFFWFIALFTSEAVQEAVELPLTHPEYYEEMGIRPPKGVILYGPPGTGKTLLAKAVANQTSATFLRIVGSELIQKYSGDGPKLVRELFRLAEEHAPSIVFIDEIDAVGTKRLVSQVVVLLAQHTLLRYDSTSGGEREIQRTMLELLNQLDGFDTRGDVKVSGCSVPFLFQCHSGHHGHEPNRLARPCPHPPWSGHHQPPLLTLSRHRPH
jgi:26S proteasome regulatory subunit T2